MSSKRRTATACARTARAVLAGLLLAGLAVTGCDAGSGRFAPTDTVPEAARDAVPKAARAAVPKTSRVTTTETNRAAAAAPASDVLLAAARAGAARFLARIPPGQESSFGFGDRAEFARVTPGPPYRLYTIQPGELAGTAPLADHLTALQRWRVPLLVDGQPRALVGVERRGASYEATDLGAAGLAREIAALEQTLPAAATDAPRAILRLFQLQSDFLFTPTTAETPRLHPLTSARRRLGLDATDARGGVSLSRLQPALRQAIQHADTRTVRP